jgi:hypothetical protein
MLIKGELKVSYLQFIFSAQMPTRTSVTTVTIELLVYSGVLIAGSAFYCDHRLGCQRFTVMYHRAHWHAVCICHFIDAEL